MKRLNPNTGLPFKRGDVREDGYIFVSYRTTKPTKENGLFLEEWSSPAVSKKAKIKARESALKQHYSKKATKTGHIWILFQKAKFRAKQENLPFNITTKYLETLPSEFCPILSLKLGWCQLNPLAKTHCPSLDKIVPELGYVEGNVHWISFKANAMKQNATFQELHQFADWVKATIPNE